MSKSILETPPPIIPVRDIHIPEILMFEGKNGVHVYQIRKAGCNVISIEFVFKAGRPFETKALAATCCAGLMREGAGGLTASEIANHVDFYGASLDVLASLDAITIRLVCLRKYLDRFTDVLAGITNEPHFDPVELSLFISRRIEKLKIELTKNEVVAYRRLTEMIFGPQHPYGYNSTPDMYRMIEQSDLKEHFDSNITSDKCTIFCAGDISQVQHRMILGMAELIRPAMRTHENLNLLLKPAQERQSFIPGSQNQSSIKLGFRLFTREHPDYAPMFFLNTLLGGYFGSRLVTNLREKKGLTYGIFSSMDTFLEDGMFMISTEVANKSIRASLDAIYSELRALQTIEVGPAELNHVSNYLSGSFLNLFDGPFNSIRAIKSLVLSQIPLRDIASLFNISRSVDSQSILTLAQRYFNRNDFWEVVVGSEQFKYVRNN